jgi:hypothetical protein
VFSHIEWWCYGSHLTRKGVEGSSHAVSYDAGLGICLEGLRKPRNISVKIDGFSVWDSNGTPQELGFVTAYVNSLGASLCQHSALSGAFHSSWAKLSSWGLRFLVSASLSLQVFGSWSRENWWQGSRMLEVALFDSHDSTHNTSAASNAFIPCQKDVHWIFALYNVSGLKVPFFSKTQEIWGCWVKNILLLSPPYPSSGTTTSLFASLRLFNYFLPFNSVPGAFCPILYFYNPSVSLYIIFPRRFWSSC